jgi:hypothetical protein
MNANTNVENLSLEIEVVELRKQVETQKQLIQLLQNKKMIQIHTQLREHENFQEENARLREQVESQKQLKHLLQNKKVSQIQPQLRESNEKFQEEMILPHRKHTPEMASQGFVVILSVLESRMQE